MKASTASELGVIGVIGTLKLNAPNAATQQPTLLMPLRQAPYRIASIAVRTRGEVSRVVEEARAHKGPFLINFLVEQEDSVYPMVPSGAALHEMIRRPHANPLIETASDT